MEKITPLPWHTGGNVPPELYQNLQCSVYSANGDKIAIIRQCDRGNGIADANAAYIVHAANLYPELVEALTRLVEEQKWATDIEAPDFALAVLAKAKRAS